jgi:uncharacterized protein
MTNELTETIKQDSRNIAVLTWLGTLFLGFIPGLYFYLNHKGDHFVQTHAKEALNWSITVLFGCVAGFSLLFILIGFPILIAVGIFQVIYCVWGIVCAFRGKPLRIPSSIRLIQ